MKVIIRSRVRRLISQDGYYVAKEMGVRVGEFRVFYDVKENNVEVLAIIPKSKATEWLEQVGEEK